MYIKISNTKNLESRLKKAIAVLDDISSENVNLGESEVTDEDIEPEQTPSDSADENILDDAYDSIRDRLNLDQKRISRKKKKAKKRKLSEASRKKRTRVSRIMATIFLGICAALLITVIVIHVSSVNELNAMSKLTDNRLVPQERYIYEAKKLGLLFAVHDDASYQEARRSINCTSELKAQFFVSQHYTGKVTDTPVTIEYEDIQYTIANDGTVGYLLHLSRIEGYEKRQYVIQAEYINEVCTYIQVLN